MASPSVNARACNVAAGFDWRTGEHPTPPRACGEPAVAIVTISCGHEHIDAPSACTACAAELRRAVPRMFCAHCDDGLEPHRCPVVVAVHGIPAGKPEIRKVASDAR